MSSKAEPKSDIETESSGKVLCFWSKTDPEWAHE